MTRCLRMTEEQLAARQGQRTQKLFSDGGFASYKKNKYNAKPVTTEEGRFASKKEYRCWCELKLREKAGEITGLRHHIKFSLFDTGGHCRGEHIGTYTADFVYSEPKYEWQDMNGASIIGNALVVADAKSEPTRKRRDWARTKALMRACHGIEVVEL